VNLAVLFADLAAQFQRDVEPSVELENTLEGVLEAARATHTEFVIADRDFLTHIAGTLGPDEDVLAALRRLAAADLYLACACARGDARALARFDREFVSQVSAYLSRSGALPGFDDEVKQALRNRILVAETSIVPRIGTYTGRGPLGAWVRMTATRLAADLRRGQGRARPMDDPSKAVEADPELQYLKQRYGAEFERALAEAFQALSPRDANLVRLYFLEHVNAQGIAQMYGVSARSVQRWLVAIQAQLLAETKKRVQERLSLSKAELESLLGLVESTLALSVSRLLSKNDPEP
jgi:RNA polymerase sigma-70 factor (ECF subfamily)